MDMDMDQQVDNASVSQHNSQNNQLEGGQIEQNAGKLQLMSPPDDSVEIPINGKVTNDEEAENLIKAWIIDPANKEFVAQHQYLN